MSVDAGTVYSSIRVRLGDLDNDLKGVYARLNQLEGKITTTVTKTEKKASESFSKIGKAMTLKVSVPLVAAAGVAVKAASDFNESIGGVETVFGKFSKTVTDFSEGAAKKAGLSMTEVNEAATVLGASLQNAGYSMEDTANMSVMLTQRAADMAALMGTNVPQALDAIKSALRGEANPIERFGVQLTEANLKVVALSKGLWDGTGEMTIHQKTAARLASIMDQTARAEGRFAVEAEGMGGKTKITTAEVKNLAISLGQELLPIASEIMGGIKKLAENFNALTSDQKKTVLSVLALAAATGPLLVGISSTIKAVEKLKIAMLALSANPIGLAIAGVAALGIGLKVLGDANNAKMLKEVGEQFGNIGELSGVAGDKILKIEEAMANASKGGAGFSETSEFVNQIAIDLGLSADQVLAIGKNSSKVTQEYKDQLDTVVLLRNQLAESNSYVIGTTQWIEKQKKIQAEIKENKQGELKAQGEISEDIKKQISSRIDAEKAYTESIAITQQKVTDGLLTQEQGEEEAYKAKNDYLDILYKIGYANKSEIGTKGREAYDELLKAVKEYNEEARGKEFVEQYKERSDAVIELSDTTKSESDKARTQALAELETMKAVTKEEKKLKQDLIDKTNEYYDNLDKKEAFDKFVENAKTGLDNASQMFSALSELTQALAAQKIQQLDDQMNAELEAAGLSEETETEKAQKKYDDAVASGDAIAIAESKQSLDRLKIQEKYEKLKADIQYKADLQSWQLKILSAMADTAGAITVASASAPWPLNLIPIGFASAIGAVQLGAISAAKPVKSYATGGIVSGGSGTLVNVAENGYDEVLFNTGPSGRAFASLMASEIVKNMGGNFGSQINHITLEVDGAKMAETTMSYVRKGIVRGEG